MQINQKGTESKASSDGPLVFTLSSPGPLQYAVAVASVVLGWTFSFYNLGPGSPLSAVLACVFIAWFVADNLIQDTYQASVSRDEVRVSRSRFGRVQSIRVGPARQLAMCNIHSEDVGRGKVMQGHRLDFEFMHDGAPHFSIPSADLLLLGDAELARLEGIERQIRLFLGLREPPRELAKRVDARQQSRAQKKAS
ncbi:MAG: hypothetical protein SGCHY_002774 [Lobulomycetales sp.]